MTLLRRCLHQLWGLFVDDPLGAGLVVGWIVLAGLVLPRLGLGAWSGPVLLAGLLAVVGTGLGAPPRR